MAATEISFIPDFDQLNEDIEDEEFQTTVDVSGAGGPPGAGAASPSQRQQQQSTIAAGLRTALLATGLVGLLANLKPITATLSALLGVISRSLVPIVEKLADFLRPIVEFVNEFAANPEEALRQRGRETAQKADIPIGGGDQVETPIEPGGEQITVDGEQRRVVTPRSQSRQLQNEIVDAISEGISAVGEFVTGGPKSADQTGEAKKQQLQQNAKEASKRRTGNFKGGNGG